MIKRIATGAAIGVGFVVAIQLFTLILAIPLLICVALDAPDYAYVTSGLLWCAAIFGAVVYVAATRE